MSEEKIHGAVGKRCIIRTNASGVHLGTVVSVDVPGTTFIVAPNTQAAKFDGTAVPGLLSVGETITY